jgi:signal transduction histidine kinase
MSIELDNKKEFSPIRRFNIAYAISLSIIAIIAIFSQVYTRQILLKQADVSHVINIAGRQRTLCQRIMKCATIIYYSDDLALRKAKLNELIMTIAPFQKVHEGLIVGDRERNLPKMKNQEVLDLFNDIQPYYNNIVNETHNIIDMKMGDRNAELKTSLDILLENEEYFLAGMDDIVYAIDSDAKDGLLLIKDIEYYSMLIMLLTLALVAIFIFIPSVNKAKKFIADLFKEKQELEEVIEDKEEANKSLRRTLEQQNEMVNMTIHDLKNPVGAIQTMVDLVEIENDEEQKNQLLNLIRETTDRLLKVLDDFIQMAVIDSQQIQLTLQYVDVNDLIQKVITQNQFLAKNKNQELKFYNKGDKLTTLADSNKIREVLENLIGNAIKYSEKKQEITVTSQMDNKAKKILVKIIDQGQGLSDDDKLNLFNRFAILSSKPTGGESSSGLGLFIAKRIIEAHNGNIFAQSDGKDKGTTFTVEIPVR